MKKIEITNIRVNLKIKNDNPSKEKAVVTLTLGPFKVKGIRILPSPHPNPNAAGEYLWITPPFYRSKNGKFHPTFFCENKTIWKKIELAIFKKYKSELSKKEIPIVE